MRLPLKSQCPMWYLNTAWCLIKPRNISLSQMHECLKYAIKVPKLSCLSRLKGGFLTGNKYLSALQCTFPRGVSKQMLNQFLKFFGHTAMFIILSFILLLSTLNKYKF